MYLIEFLASVSRILSSGRARCGEGKQSKSSKLVVKESVGRQSDQYPSSAEILLGNSGNRVSQEAVARGLPTWLLAPPGDLIGQEFSQCTGMEFKAALPPGSLLRKLSLMPLSETW